MLRLWNMLDGRCTFKKKLGLNDLEDTDAKSIDKVRKVKWSPYSDDVYIVMYEKKLEILKVDSEKPLNSVTTEN